MQKGIAQVYLLIILLIIGGLVVAYYLGKFSNRIFTIKPSPIATQQLTKGIDDWKVYTSNQLPNNTLKPYSLKYPNSWVEKNIRENRSDTLKLIKGEYIVTIYQAAYGGGGCIFEGEIPEGPFDDLRDVKYIEIKSEVGAFRRFIKSANNNLNITHFDFCLNANDQYFASPTPYGIISYDIPKNYNQATLEEMDRIIATLKEAK